MYVFMMFVSKYPRIGSNPWKKLVVHAKSKRVLFWQALTARPYENETTQASMDKAIANKIISI